MDVSRTYMLADSINSLVEVNEKEAFLSTV